MQFFIAALIGGLIQAAGSLVGRVLLSLGIGYAAYSGIDTSIAWMKQQVVSNLAGMGAQAVATMGALQVGKIISIITSAMLTRLTVQGLTGGTLKRMRVK